MEKNTSYDVASQFCKNQGAYLFQPKSEKTNKSVFDKSIEVFGGEYQSWIGINYKAAQGGFVFESSREKVPSFFWHPDNQHRSIDDCVLMGYPGQKEKWSDRPCSESSYSICEFGSTGKYIKCSIQM